MLLLIFVALLLLIGIPQTGLHSYGYGPSGILGIVLVILIILFFTGRI